MESNSDISSTQSLQQLNQDRLELIQLRKQRKKMELLADELDSLENMYAVKVQQNLELKTCLKQLKSLVELFEAEKNEQLLKEYRLQQDLDISRQKLENYITEAQKLYQEKEQLKMLLERQKMRYMQNQKTLSNKAQKLQYSLQEFENRISAKDKQANRMSTNYMSQQETMKVLNEKILLLTQQVQDKDITLIRLNGELKIQKDQNQSLKQKLKSSNQTFRQINQRCRQLQLSRDRSTQMFQQQMQMMQQQHSHQMQSFKNQNYLNKKVSSSKKNNYKQSMRNQINALKNREFQRIDSLINNKIVRTNNQLAFY